MRCNREDRHPAAATHHDHSAEGSFDDVTGGNGNRTTKPCYDEPMRKGRGASTVWCPLVICCVTACGSETAEGTRMEDGPRDAGATIDAGTGAPRDAGRRSPEHGVRFANFAY